MAAHASKAAFSWVPKVDLYPLFSVFALAGGVCTYASLRCIMNNPDVHLTKEHKQDGAHETGITLNRAKSYYGSVFRSIADLRPSNGERRDVRIFQ